MMDALSITDGALVLRLATLGADLDASPDALASPSNTRSTDRTATTNDCAPGRVLNPSSPVLPMRSLTLVLALLAALPAAAQPLSPDSLMISLWEELLAGAEAAAWNIDHALFEDSVATVEASEARAATFRRGIVTASHAAASSAGSLAPILQMEIVLAEPDRQAEVEATLGEPAVALYYALATIVDEAANVAASEAPPDAALRDTWQQYAAAVRSILPLVRDARASLAP